MTRLQKLKHGLIAGFLAGGICAILTALITPDTLSKGAQVFEYSSHVIGVAVYFILGGGLYGLLTHADISKLRSSVYGLVYGYVLWVAHSYMTIILSIPIAVALGTGERLLDPLPLPSFLGYGVVLGFLTAVFAHKVKENHEAKKDPDPQTEKMF